jgi:hypothetical protein
MGQLMGDKIDLAVATVASSAARAGALYLRHCGSTEYLRGTLIARVRELMNGCLSRIADVPVVFVLNGAAAMVHVRFFAHTVGVECNLRQRDCSICRESEHPLLTQVKRKSLARLRGMT